MAYNPSGQEWGVREA